MGILYVGIDLAKSVFAVHGVDEHGKAVLVRPSVARAKLHDLIASLPPCTVGMEACSGAHHWGRVFEQHGHRVRLLAPKLVTPYRMTGKRGKNDAADAAAICEAVQRPNMRFVPIKSLEAQARLCVHRVRRGFIEERTAVINRVRGLLSEFGIVLPQQAKTVRRQAAAHMEDLPGWANTAVGDCLSEVYRLACSTASSPSTCSTARTPELQRRIQERLDHRTLQDGREIVSSASPPLVRGAKVEVQPGSCPSSKTVDGRSETIADVRFRVTKLVSAQSP